MADDARRRGDPAVRLRTEFAQPFRESFGPTPSVSLPMKASKSSTSRSRRGTGGGPHPGDRRQARYSSGAGARFLGDGALFSYRPWHDKRNGMTHLRPDGGKCVYYYFYFIDEVLGLSAF